MQLRLNNAQGTVHSTHRFLSRASSSEPFGTDAERPGYLATGSYTLAQRVLCTRSRARSHGAWRAANPKAGVVYDSFTRAALNGSAVVLWESREENE